MLQYDEFSPNEHTCVTNTQMKKQYFQHPQVPLCAPLQELKNPKENHQLDFECYRLV